MNAIERFNDWCDRHPTVCVIAWVLLLAEAVWFWMEGM